MTCPPEMSPTVYVPWSCRVHVHGGTILDASEKPEWVGRPVEQVFDTADHQAIIACSTHGWLGVMERRWLLATGRVVQIIPLSAEQLLLVDQADVAAVEEQQGRESVNQAMRMVSAATARELSDPLAIVQGRLELLLALGLEDPEAALAHIDLALRYARQASHTLRNLRLVGSPAPRDVRNGTRLSVAVTESLVLVGSRSEAVTVDVSEALQVDLPDAMLSRILANQLRLVLSGTRRSERVVLSAHRSDDQVVVSLRPRGWAHPEGAGAPDRSIDALLLEACGGRLRAQRKGAAVAVELVLPCAVHLLTRSRRGRGVAIVVGEHEFVETMALRLGLEGFEVHESNSAEDALAKLELLKPDVVVARLRLPGASGVALLRAAQAEHRILVVDRHVHLEDAPFEVLVRPIARVPLLAAMGITARRR